MDRRLSIIYPYRERSLEMVRVTLASLATQTGVEFEVVFVDYGSSAGHLSQLEELISEHDFVRLVAAPAFGRLWSRSVCLNIGIKAARHELVFIVDVDLYFSPRVLEFACAEFEPGCFFGGTWHFLSQSDSDALLSDFTGFQPRQFKLSDDNGMLLIEKRHLSKVHGYDEFFHLYGGEDTDLKIRLENLGLQKKSLVKPVIFHLWHPHVIQQRPKTLVGIPYAYNVKRINEKHVFFNKDLGLTIPAGQDRWGEVVGVSENQTPDRVFQLENVHSVIIHFFQFSIFQYHGELIDVFIEEAKPFGSVRARLKKLIKGNSEPFMNMQKVNELITEQLIFAHRQRPYRYQVDVSAKRMHLRLAV